MFECCVICHKKIPEDEDHGTFFAKNGDIGAVCRECVEEFFEIIREVREEDD